MIAQLLLTLLLTVVVLYAWTQLRRSPAVGALSLLAAVTGLYVVWTPKHATVLAEFAGVGRGADLITYLWIAIRNALDLMLSHFPVGKPGSTLPGNAMPAAATPPAWHRTD
jgi:hypothetical protein